MSQTILRLPTVKSRTGLSRSSIYLKISQKAFPRQIKIGLRQVGWLESEINFWIEERINISRKSGGNNQ